MVNGEKMATFKLEKKEEQPKQEQTQKVTDVWDRLNNLMEKVKNLKSDHPEDQTLIQLEKNLSYYIERKDQLNNLKESKKYAESFSLAEMENMYQQLIKERNEFEKKTKIKPNVPIPDYLKNADRVYNEIIGKEKELANNLSNHLDGYEKFFNTLVDYYDALKIKNDLIKEKEKYEQEMKKHPGIKSYKQEIDNLNKKIAAQKQKLNEIQNDLIKQMQTIEQQKQTIKQQKQTIEQQKNEIDRLNAEIDRLNAKLAEAGISSGGETLILENKKINDLLGIAQIKDRVKELFTGNDGSYSVTLFYNDNNKKEKKAIDQIVNLVKGKQAQLSSLSGVSLSIEKEQLQEALKKEIDVGKINTGVTISFSYNSEKKKLTITFEKGKEERQVVK